MNRGRTGWSAAGPGDPGVADTGRPPGRLAQHVVRTAVRLIPRGPTRDRYRAELVAELYDVPPERRARHVLGVVVGMPALRHVVRSAARESWEELVGRRRAPRRLACVLNVRHAWRTFSTEDGQRYRACVHCEKDYPVRDGRTEDEGKRLWWSAGM